MDTQWGYSMCMGYHIYILYMYIVCIFNMHIQYGAEVLTRGLLPSTTPTNKLTPKRLNVRMADKSVLICVA
jgi:hypothetical protein